MRTMRRKKEKRKKKKKKRRRGRRRRNSRRSGDQTLTMVKCERLFSILFQILEEVEASPPAPTTNSPPPVQ